MQWEMYNIAIAHQPEILVLVVVILLLCRTLWRLVFISSVHAYGYVEFVLSISNTPETIRLRLRLRAMAMSRPQTLRLPDTCIREYAPDHYSNHHNLRLLLLCVFLVQAYQFSNVSIWNSTNFAEFRLFWHLQKWKKTEIFSRSVFEALFLKDMNNTNMSNASFNSTTW